MMIQDGDRLSGRSAIVTGAARGIGEGIARRLCANGARVVAADLERTAVEQTAAAIRADGGECMAIRVDVTDRDSVVELVNFTLTEFNRIDILVNNAGVMFRTRFADISLEEWQRTMDVNLTGSFLCSQAVLSVMKQAGFGRIVNISSSAGRSVSTLGGAHYTASKAGLLGLTRAMAKEVAPFGLTVNAVCPGLIDTQMARATTTGEELSRFIHSFPIRRLGSPEEMGDLVVFLCSSEAGYITGVSVDINGGDLMI